MSGFSDNRPPISLFQPRACAGPGLFPPQGKEIPAAGSAPRTRRIHRPPNAFQRLGSPKRRFGKTVPVSFKNPYSGAARRASNAPGRPCGGIAAALCGKWLSFHIPPCAPRGNFSKYACQWKSKNVSYLRYFCASLAQLVEQLICNHQVVGSSPTAGSTLKQRLPMGEAFVLKRG